MNTLFIILGVILALLFFLNIKPASEVLCRIVCGFAVLIGYNAVAPALLLVPIGINLISALLIGIFGAPGAIMLYIFTFVA